MLATVDRILAPLSWVLAGLTVITLIAGPLVLAEDETQPRAEAAGAAPYAAPRAPTAAATAAAPAAADGKAVFSDNCGGCHTLSDAGHERHRRAFARRRRARRRDGRGHRPRRPRRHARVRRLAQRRADPGGRGLRRRGVRQLRPRDWNAESYQRISAPMEAMGREVLDRLELRGDERVLDAGCGTGRVTAALVERLPRGEVVAVDGSPAMVAEARERLGPGVEVFAADLLELELDRPVDAILSTATFHWIADHDRLFERLFAALRPGGRIVAQCGGAGNVGGRAGGDRRGRRARAGGLAGAMDLRVAGGDGGAARADRLHRGARVAAARPRRARRPARVHGHDHARLAPRAAAGGAARRRSSTPCWRRCPSRSSTTCA